MPRTRSLRNRDVRGTDDEGLSTDFESEAEGRMNGYASTRSTRRRTRLTTTTIDEEEEEEVNNAEEQDRHNHDDDGAHGDDGTNGHASAEEDAEEEVYDDPASGDEGDAETGADSGDDESQDGSDFDAAVERSNRLSVKSRGALSTLFGTPAGPNKHHHPPKHFQLTVRQPSQLGCYDVCRALVLSILAVLLLLFFWWLLGVVISSMDWWYGWGVFAWGRVVAWAGWVSAVVSQWYASSLEAIKTKPTPISTPVPEPVGKDFSASFRQLSAKLHALETTHFQDFNSLKDSVDGRLTVLETSSASLTDGYTALMGRVDGPNGFDARISALENSHVTPESLADLARRVDQLRIDVDKDGVAINELRKRIDGLAGMKPETGGLTADEVKALIAASLNSDEHADSVQGLITSAVKHMSLKQFVSLKTDISSMKNTWLSEARSDMISVADVEGMIQRAINLYAADRIGRTDLALYSAGACVIVNDGFTSATYGHVGEAYPSKSEHGVRVLLMDSAYDHRQTPAAALTPWSLPGQCWPMNGTSGALGVRLATSQKIRSVSVDHASASLVDRSGAPKDCEVYAYRSLSDESPVLLSKFSYDINGPDVQTFPADLDPSEDTYGIVQLRVLNNHGRQDSTCLYRFRVHPE